MTRCSIVMTTVIAILVWLIILAPAQVLSSMFADSGSPFLAQGFRGSLWSGSIDNAAIIYQGDVLPLGRVSWKVEPGAMFKLRPCAAFSSLSRSLSAVQSVQGLACVSPKITGSELTLSDVSVQMPAAIMLRGSELALGGQISATLHTLRWDGADLSQFSMRGIWSEPTLSGELGAISLHTLPFNLDKEGPQTLRLSINNAGANHQLAGTPPLLVDLVSTVDLDGSFSARAVLGLTDSTPLTLRQWLPVIAEQRSINEYYAEWRSQQI